MKFLLNCRRCKIIPPCLKSKDHLKLDNEASRRELEKVTWRHQIRLLSVMIADTKRTMASTKKAKQSMDRKMEEKFDQRDAERVRKMVKEKTATVYRKVRTREIRKMARMKAVRITEMNSESNWIENTTSAEIPDYVERTLMLGPNFNIEDNRDLPYIELVASIEKAIQCKENAEEIRSEVSNAMINHINYQRQPRHPPEEWIRKDVIKSRKYLKENPNLVVTKADKGSKTVILDAEEYHSKMQSLLEDESTYKKLPSNPTNKILRKINGIIDMWHRSGYIDFRIQRKLKESSCNPPRIYGLPKTHKENRPMRPVVSTIGSATYKIARYLSDIIGNVVGKTNFHVRNSFEFADQITGVQTDEGEVLFSLDVVSLYTNVPVDYALRCLEERWTEIEQHTNIDKESFIEAVKVVLESTFFVYRGTVYAQTFGVPMGSPLSPVIANVVMEKLEQESISNLETKQIHMKVYRRYVDDCLCVARREHIETIVDTFNSFHERLQFTVEYEKDGKIKFLDMMLEREADKITTAWLPKQTDGRYLDFNSKSPFQHKENTAIALIDRAIKLSCGFSPQEALDQATRILRKNNYPTWFVNRVRKKRVHKHYNTMEERTTSDQPQKYASAPYIPCLNEKLRKILQKHNVILASRPQNKIKKLMFSKMKDPIPPGKQTNVVYSIPCGAEDGKVYIGQTKRMLEVRIAEHKNDSKKRVPKSGLAVHTIEEGHVFDFDSTTILERIEHPDTRMIAEVFHIKKLGEQQTVNLQRECGNFNTTYNGLLARLRGETRARTRERTNDVENEPNRMGVE
ncbi:uncharacterized protein LOC134288748 [Aedes albopictus]|uniref:Reverse transcriptase domain-containing protein n=1 Tax=Aedes albopictus TaxID=7160 RepID=A0ABM1YAN9_AEDAL